MSTQKNTPKSAPTLPLRGAGVSALAVWCTANRVAAVYSVLLHAGLACILAALVIAAKPTGNSFPVDATFSSAEMEAHSLDFESCEIAITEPAEDVGSLHSMVTAATAMLALLPEADVSIPSLPVGALRATEHAAGTHRNSTSKPGRNGSAVGTGNGGTDGPGRASFFGKEIEANSVAFVIDASGSMHGSRFQRAREELANSLGKLKPDQQFFVVFYTDQTYPLFYPKNTIGLIQANPRTLQQVYSWMQGSQAQGGTRPQAAMAMTLKLRPDAIFFLSDGQIPIETTGVVARLNRGSVIHTISFGSDAGGDFMRQIAEANGGTYRFIPDGF